MRAIAARSPWGVETVHGGQLEVVEPDPVWLFDPERLIYWAFVCGPLPAGSPLCGAHRAVYDVERGEIVHQYDGLGRSWKAGRDGGAGRRIAAAGGEGA